MLSRLLTALLLSGLLLVGMVAGPALAAEGGGEFTEYEDIVGQADDAAADFIPAEYERPGFFDWFIFPLVVVGVLIVGLILSSYLASQPRFEREAQEKSRR